MSSAGEGESPEKNQLRRSLSLFGAVAISIGLMTPSMAANIAPQATAGVVGRAVPLAFVLALVTVVFVAHSFVPLTQHFHHHGWVYGFIGATLGPRVSVLAGWALFSTYVLFAVITAAAAGIFASAFVGDAGIWHNPPDWAPFAIVPFVLAGVWGLALFSARTRYVGSREAVIPVAGLVGFTVYYKLEFSTASGPGFWNRVVAGVWLAVGIVVALPGMARRGGVRLLQDDGVSLASGADDNPQAQPADG